MQNDPIPDMANLAPAAESAPEENAALIMAEGLASAAYDLDLAPFLAAGWQDATIQLGPKVIGGMNLDEEQDAPEGLEQARKLLEHGKQAARTVTSGIREWRSGTGVKAVCMLRPMADGRFLVAIAFMGSVQLDDWIANFDMVNETGLHRGYQKRAQAFEDTEPEITFPRTAEQLGLKELTLRTVIERCAQADSPFRLFLTGHSMGGALLQVYVHRLLTARGVRRELVQGIGFASPTVAAGNAVEDPSDWPLCHVLNSDDCVPRLGAEVHLGRCLRYPADWALRNTCYGLTWDEESLRKRRLALPVYTMMKDTASALAVVCGILRAIGDTEPAELLPALGRVGADRPAMQRLIDAGDSRADRMIQSIIRRADAACASVTGHRTDQALADEAKARFTMAVEAIGVRDMLNTMLQIGMAVHNMRRADGPAAYEWIARRPLSCFEPFAWERGRPPRRRSGRWTV